MQASHKAGSNRTPEPKDHKEAIVYMTAKSPSCLLVEREHRAFEPLDQPDENYPTIMIDVDKTFQTMDCSI